MADGVGLWEGIEYVGNYPRISGNARLSKVFAEAFVKYMARHPDASIPEGFRVGNTAAKKINAGRSKYTVFREHKGLFAATATMAVVRKNILRWGHICDAGVTVIDSKGNLKLRKESCNHSFSWPKDSSKFYTLTTNMLSAIISLTHKVGKEVKCVSFAKFRGG